MAAWRMQKFSSAASPELVEQ